MRNDTTESISIHGAGYVGLVTAACFAEIGYRVVCTDTDEERIKQLRSGVCPIHEPGLDVMLHTHTFFGARIDGKGTQRIRFTRDAVSAIESSAMQFICVGTPPNYDGSVNTDAVEAVAKSIAKHKTGRCTIVVKSTVPVGTADKLQEIVSENARGDLDFDIVSHPEFQREGNAVQEWMNPDRLIIGSDSARAIQAVRNLYAKIMHSKLRIIAMDNRSAELTKYANNAMLATRISFINEMAQVSARLGADIDKVREGIGADSRIGREYLKPGPGYGGSCLPKDVRAMISRDRTGPLHLLHAVEKVNERAKTWLFDRIGWFFGGKLEGKRVGVWGLAFKADTDDMRNASSRQLIGDLVAAGARVSAYDPAAMRKAKEMYDGVDRVEIVGSADAALAGADVLAICTAWPIFRTNDLGRFDGLKERAIFDAVNLYSETSRGLLASAGIRYFSVGR